MAALNPSVNDDDYALLRKIVWNFYTYAIDFGVTGIDSPSMNDTYDILLKKWCYITAKLVDNHP